MMFPEHEVGGSNHEVVGIRVYDTRQCFHGARRNAHAQCGKELQLTALAPDSPTIGRMLALFLYSRWWSN